MGNGFVYKEVPFGTATPQANLLLGEPYDASFREALSPG